MRQKKYGRNSMRVSRKEYDETHSGYHKIEHCDFHMASQSSSGSGHISSVTPVHIAFRIPMI